MNFIDSHISMASQLYWTNTKYLQGIIFKNHILNLIFVIRFQIQYKPNTSVIVLSPPRYLFPRPFSWFIVKFDGFYIHIYIIHTPYSRGASTVGFFFPWHWMTTVKICEKKKTEVDKSSFFGRFVRILSAFKARLGGGSSRGLVKSHSLLQLFIIYLYLP